ncbi:unnamed protein product [Kluyveromyces dobzhanskii CBS 2104]|uniref:WGS project CCBQ000000000 data, contig 00028 n=1 Tax=Kluyveromyces dobzhanskii CBS 2104 TaxID=1427455 RepID=A0A0A8KZ11_9SACH|nr:unnamed protein product [Kluyveromyces dobzhanskii CBS 2104]
MPTCVQVKDFYQNDYNGLWSWYLSNLRKGEFEELTGNELKYGILKRFLKDQFQGTGPLNKKLLLVSIPDEIHQDIEVLEEFLSEYFHLRDGHTNIVIDKLTRGTIYNHESHYLIQDKLTNFNDEWLLEMKKDVSITGNDGKNATDLTENCRQIVQDDSPRQESDSDDGYSVMTGDTFDTESHSIVLNFKHPDFMTRPKSTVTKRVIRIKPENHTGSPPESQVSILTHGEDLESYRGEELVQTVTRTVDEDDEDNEDVNSFNGNGVFTGHRDIESDDDIKSRDISIPPSISISDDMGTFRLVLQSILIPNKETGQIFTGIRQSENDRSNADINDDWLLYDTNFDLGNLQMLSLYDILDFSKFLPKILFYSMIHVKDKYLLENNEENSSQQFITAKNTLVNGNSYATHDADDVLSELSSDNSIEGFNGDSNNSIIDEPVIGLYSPTTAATAGHRSIRTIESIGAWALSRSNTKKSMDTVQNTISRDSRGNFMNRIKSQPMPVLAKTLSMNKNDKTIKIKKDLAKVRGRKRKKSISTNCIIM